MALQCRANVHGWITTTGLFLVTCISLSTVKSMGVYFSEMQTSLGTTEADLGLMLGLYSGFTSGPAPIITVLYGYVECRRYLLVVGAAFSSISFGIGSFVSNNGQLTACLSFAGLGGCILATCFVIALQEESGDNFQILYGIGKSGYSFGMVLVPIFAEYLMNIYGWRGSMLVVGAVFGQVIPLTMCVNVKANSSFLMGTDVRTGMMDKTQPGCLEHNLQLDNLQLDLERSSECGDGMTTEQRRNSYSNADGAHSDIKSSMTRRHTLLEGTEEYAGSSEGAANSQRTGFFEALSDIILQTWQSAKDALLQLDRWVPVFIVSASLGGWVIGAWHAFLIPRTVKSGFPLSSAMLLLYPAAITCFFARALSGLLHRIRCLSTLDLYLLTKVMDALFLVLDVLIKTYAFKFITTIIIAFCIHVYSVLLVFVIKERVSFSSFPIAVSLLSVAYGFGALIGTYLTGLIADLTGNYDASFLLLAAVDAFNAVLVFPTRFRPTNTRNDSTEH